MHDFIQSFITIKSQKQQLFTFYLLEIETLYFLGIIGRKFKEDCCSCCIVNQNFLAFNSQKDKDQSHQNVFKKVKMTEQKKLGDC